MTTILIILLVAVLFALAFIIYILTQRKNDTGAALIKQDLLALNQGISTLKDGLQSHLTDRLDKNQAMISQQFSESSKIIADVTERLTKLDETNKRVVDVADELKLLQN